MTNFDKAQKAYEQMLPPDCDEDDDDFEPDAEDAIERIEEGRWL